MKEYYHIPVFKDVSNSLFYIKPEVLNYANTLMFRNFILHDSFFSLSTAKFSVCNMLETDYVCIFFFEILSMFSE